MKKVACISAFILAFAVMPLAQGENVVVESKLFTITLTGKESFQKLIKAGKYDSVDEELLEINPKFGKLARATHNLILVEFNEELLTDEVPERLKNIGFRPATLAELLAFGAKYPNEQLLAGRPILSPNATIEFAVDTPEEEKGRVWTYHVYLRGVGDKRMLSTNFVGMFWNKNWRCLAALMTETETKITAPLLDHGTLLK